MRMYHAMNRSIIGKKEISKETKMKIYKTVFRPIRIYGCESWIVKINSEVGSKQQK